MLNDVRIFNESGKEIPKIEQKQTLHELTLQTMNKDEKKHLFVYDGEFTLMLNVSEDGGKRLWLCKGKPEECETNKTNVTKCE